MALYEYLCGSCGNRFEKRMPMSEVLQLVPCPNCKKKAKKVIGSFAIVGVADSSLGDGPAPWEDGGDMPGMGGGDHGHSHGGDHGHSHGADDLGDDWD